MCVIRPNGGVCRTSLTKQLKYKILIYIVENSLGYFKVLVFLQFMVSNFRQIKFQTPTKIPPKISLQVESGRKVMNTKKVKILQELGGWSRLRDRTLAVTKKRAKISFFLVKIILNTKIFSFFPYAFCFSPTSGKLL